MNKSFLRLYDKGLTDKQIAKTLGVHPRTVGEWRKEKNLPSLTPRRKVSKDGIETIKRMYLQGYPLKEIGKKFGIRIETVNRYTGLFEGRTPSKGKTTKAYQNEIENRKKGIIAEITSKDACTYEELKKLPQPFIDNDLCNLLLEKRICKIPMFPFGKKRINLGNFGNSKAVYYIDREKFLQKLGNSINHSQYVKKRDLTYILNSFLTKEEYIRVKSMLMKDKK